METKALIDRINRIRWRERAEITPEAMKLIERHIELVRPVVQHIMCATGKPVSDAHGDALTPAHGTPEEGEVLDALFGEAEFANAGVREPLILTFAASELWHLDPELSVFPNPWRPLVELAYLGYPTSYDDAPDMSSVGLLVGLRDGIQGFPVVPSVADSVHPPISGELIDLMQD